MTDMEEKKYERSKLEQETIIIYNNAEPDAVISTYDQKLINALRSKFGSFSSVITELKNGEGFAEYTCPKEWVKIRFPRKLSSERREQLRKEMMCINTNRKGDTE